MAIRNPVEWGWEALHDAAVAVGSAGRAVMRVQAARPAAAAPTVRRIKVADLKQVLARGLEDFGAYRSDVIFLCLIYPVVGLVLVRLAFGYEMLPLLFPLASGFTLIGPVAAVGLYEMSRRREQGQAISWADSFGVVRSQQFGAIAVLGLILLTIFMVWLAVAWAIYDTTLGPEPPAAIATFVNDVLTTAPGWTMIVVGCGVGFLFALLVLAISVVSFPLLIDRDVALGTAIRTSVRAVAENPVPMALWGIIVAGSLLVGTLPVFLGLIIVMPVLGHATWHLYRKVVAR